jgi:hypothetical protein
VKLTGAFWRRGYHARCCYTGMCMGRKFHLNFRAGFVTCLFVWALSSFTKPCNNPLKVLACLFFVTWETLGFSNCSDLCSSDPFNIATTVVLPIPIHTSFPNYHSKQSTIHITTFPLQHKLK